jgi:hypothetical protein
VTGVLNVLSVLTASQILTQCSWSLLEYDF